MKAEKVLVVHNYYQIPGGEDTVVANEIKLLEDHGHEVLLYSRNNTELKTFSKVQKLLLPITTVFNPKTYKEVKKIIKEKNIDIVHVHNTLNLVSPSVYYAARSCKVPIVQTIHNFRLLCPAATLYRDGHICEECLQKGILCSLKYNCYRGSKLQTLACVLTSKIHRAMGIYKKINYICLTEFNKNKLLEINNGKRKKLILPKQVYVKPNFTFEELDCSNAEDGKYYLFVGRVEKIKGMDVLIEAFSNLPEETIVIAGKGTELEYYQEQMVQRNLKNVSFLGFQKKEQVQELMKNAKAMIVPSQWYEGFPMTIVEALSAGTPVIGADIGNISSLVKQGVNGWKFKYDSPQELVNAIKLCNRTPRKNLNVSCDGAVLAEENYKVLKQIYENALKCVK